MANPGRLTVALDVYRASPQGKPAQVIGRANGRSAQVPRLVQAWRSKLRDDAIRKQVVTIRVRLGITKHTAPSEKIDAWDAAIDVKPVQLREQRLTRLSRSGLLSY